MNEKAIDPDPETTNFAFDSIFGPSVNEEEGVVVIVNHNSVFSEPGFSESVPLSIEVDANQEVQIITGEQQFVQKDFNEISASVIPNVQLDELEEKISFESNPIFQETNLETTTTEPIVQLDEDTPQLHSSEQVNQEILRVHPIVPLDEMEDSIVTETKVEQIYKREELRKLNNIVAQTENSPLLGSNKDLNEEEKKKKAIWNLIWRRTLPKTRMECIDVSRGIGVFAMIIVLNQGNPNYVYSGVSEPNPPYLRLADFIFPLFLFLVGMNIPISNVTKALRNIHTWTKPLFRVLLFIVIGIFLNILACNFQFSDLRIPGYLQRIALCYLIVTYIYLLSHQIIQKAIIFCFMAIYLVLLYVLNVPNCGQGRITDQCNAVGYIDRQIFGQHMILPTDPEGFFSTLSAISTCYIGLEFGRVALSYKSRHIYILLIWGFTTVGMLVTGILLENWLPWNGRIYSFTYAMVGTGFAGALIFFLYILVEINWVGAKWMIKILSPFKWLGVNPLFIYLLMQLINIALTHNLKVEYNGEQTGIWTWIYWNLFAVWIASEKFASLFVSILWLLFYELIAFLLYRWKMFIII